MRNFQSPRLQKKKRKIFKIKLILWFLVVLFTVLCISSVSHLNFLNIQKVVFTGNEITKTGDLFDITIKETEGKYFWLFSKRNSFFYPKKEIEDKILKEFPRIEEINFDTILKELKIVVKEREPVALWCEDGIANCFLIDNDSYIFAKSSGGEYFRYYKDLGAGDFLRKNIFESEKFEEIKSFVEFVRGLNLEPYKLVIVEDKSEIYFGDGSRIFFDDTQNIKEVINNLQSVLNMEEFVSGEKIKEVDYIDLRFRNKVFYK